MSNYYYNQPQYVQPNSYTYEPELSSPDEYYEQEPRSYASHSRHGSFNQYHGDKEYYSSSYAPAGSHSSPRHSSYSTGHGVPAYYAANDRHGYAPTSPTTTSTSMSRNASDTGRLSNGARHSISSASPDRPHCPHLECRDENGRPTRYFSRKADVQRHVRSQHGAPFIDCPKPKCARKGDNGFTRKDHCDEHRRQYHSEPLPKRNGSGSRGSGGRHAA